MIHPSYNELMKVVNNNAEYGEEPVVNSRYSIVIASAKRARQIIGGAEPLVPNAAGKKPLSIAVEELYTGNVKILGEDDDVEAIANFAFLHAAFFTRQHCCFCRSHGRKYQGYF